MSTRGVIARVTPDGVVCAYNHWDSYPSALGKTLWELYHGHFNRELETMLKVLVDEHPSWSTINDADFQKAPGYIEYPRQTRHDGTDPPQCYCHGDRSEDVSNFPLSEAAGVGCEWAYLLDPRTRHMQVLSSYRQNGSKMIGMFGAGDPDSKWAVVADVALEGDEPDWKGME